MRALVPLVCVVLFALSAFAFDEIPAAPLELTQIEPWFPALATDGENYFAVWSDRRDPRRPAVYGARITPDREVLDPVGVPLLEGTDPISIAYGLGRYFILGRSLRFVIVDREARIVARGVVANEPAAQSAQVLFNGSDFVTFWSNNAVRTATLDPFGNMVRWPDNVVSDRPVLFHSAATDGARILVTYTAGTNLYVAGTSLVGERLFADKLISETAGWWTPATIAAARGQFALTWLSDETPDDTFDTKVRTMRLDANGDALGPSLIAIPWNAQARMIATEDGFRLYEQQELRVMKYTLTNELAPATATPVVDRQRPDVVTAFAVAEGPGGTMVLATFGHPFPYPPAIGLYAADGDTQDAPVLVSRAGTTQTEPDVAIGDDGMLVVWNERERPHVGATFFASNGTSRTFDVAEKGSGPAVATQGRAYLVAWTGFTGSRARVIQDGFVIGDEIDLRAGNSVVAAAREGNDFVVAATGGTLGAPLQLSRINNVGHVVSQSTFAAPAQLVSRVALACDRGECLVTWVEQTFTPGCFPYRCAVYEQVMAMPFDASLTPRYSSPIALTQRENIRTNDLDVAAFDGSYAVAWQSTGGIVTARTISQGQQLGTAFTLPGSSVAVERESGGWLLVREVNTELVTAHFTADHLDAGAPLAHDAQWRSAPALARKGEQIVLAYERTTIGEAAGGVVRAYVADLPPSAPRRRTARH
ncbi:MAG TPA: hypothetical protein VM733_10450 [Thermoanaerobaculia bacterium]|nr:hypothetical protein [Thermoanaerobaculia bacterium]